MRARLLLVACGLLIATRAVAEVRVMAYGDSITAGSDPENSYPGQLQRLRSDLAVANEGHAGDVSDNRDRFRQALADRRSSC